MHLAQLKENAAPIFQRYPLHRQFNLMCAH